MADRQAYLYFRLMNATTRMMRMFAEYPIYRERVNWHYIYSLFNSLKIQADLLMNGLVNADSLTTFEDKLVSLENVITRLEQNETVP